MILCPSWPVKPVPSREMALSQGQPGSRLLKWPLNLRAFRAPVRAVLPAEGWASEAAHAERVAGFPGEPQWQLITSAQLAAAPAWCKPGSPFAVLLQLERGPWGRGGEAGELRD